MAVIRIPGDPLPAPGRVVTRAGIEIGRSYIPRRNHVTGDAVRIQSLLLRKPCSLKRRAQAAAGQALWVFAVLVGSVAIWRL